MSEPVSGAAFSGMVAPLPTPPREPSRIASTSISSRPRLAPPHQNREIRPGTHGFQNLPEVSHVAGAVFQADDAIGLGSSRRGRTRAAGR